MADIASPIKARGRFVRSSARKARLVVDLIRGMDVEEALAVLKYNNKGVSKDVEKILRSAVANAEENHEVRDVADLYVQKAWVDEGPTMKRFRPRTMGMASRIRKRTCHITLILAEYE